MRFLDTNIILRYITGDDPAQQQIAAEILGKVERGEEVAMTTAVHLHEVAYVLASRALYGLGHGEIRDRLRPIILLRGLKVHRKSLCLEALDLFATHGFLDFADALAAASLTHDHLDGIYSFDTDFDRIPDIVRYIS